MKNLGGLLRTIAEVLRQTVLMADIYSVLGMVAFAAAMLGLIWVLDRV
jgi:hypothetical protein